MKTPTQQWHDSRNALAFDPDLSGPAPMHRADRIVLKGCAIAAAALGIILWTSDAKAQATDAPQDQHRVHVVLHGLSHHFTPRQQGEWNERNTGVGIRYQLDATWGAQAGAYKNSISRTSWYAWIEGTPLEWHVAAGATLSGGMFAGMVNGYKANDGGFRPVAGLLARTQTGPFSLTMRYVPKGSVDGSPVRTIEAGWRF